MRLKKLPNLKSKIQKEFDFDLPVDYVVSKFYELGYKVSHNKALGSYQSCCPLCREGKSWGKKKRCVYTPSEGIIGCYNCGESLSTYNWIRRVSGMTHKELADALEADNYDIYTTFEENTRPEIVVATLPEDSINLFDPIQKKFYANNKKVKFTLDYIKKRRLDTAVNRPDALYISLKDKFQGERLVIPFKDEQGDIVFFQTRKLFDYDDKPSYLSKLKADKTLYGIDKVDPNMDTVFLFEGPIDAFFVKNGIGVAGINKGHHTLTPTQKEQMESLRLFKKIWVLDSQWKDETAREKTISLLELGETVFIWPKKWGEAYKDLNEMCIDCKIDQISPEFIKKNAVSGMNSVLKFKMMIR
jgi:hypothetical protein